MSLLGQFSAGEHAALMFKHRQNVVVFQMLKYAQSWLSIRQFDL